MKYVAVASLGLLIALGACEPEPSGRAPGTPSPPRAMATVTVTFSGVPTPRPPREPTPVTFAPGETVSPDDLGLFLLDPATGITEGWPSQTPDGRCTMRDTTGDGLKLLFDCNASAAGATAARGGDTTDTYALDLMTGAWTLEPRREAPYGIVAPNGDPLSAAAAAAIGALLSGAPSLVVLGVSWAPDGSALVVTIGDISPPDPAPADFLVRAGSGESIRLAATGNAVWTASGSGFALLDCCRDGQATGGTVAVFDSSGRKLWERELATDNAVNPRWSTDSQWFGVQVLRFDASEADYALGDLDVFDGASGEFAFRVRDAVACAGQYWTADNRLVVGGWRQQEVVDPRTGSIFPLERYVTPSPTDPDLGISFDGNDFYAVNLSDGSERLIARTTVSPAWDFAHEPLFAGSRIRFRPRHGGHGGCGEGIGVPKDSRPRLEFPPFPAE